MGERHHAVAADLASPRNDEGFTALAAGALPDRDVVLASVDRLHQLLLPESLPGARTQGDAERLVAQQLAEIEPALANEIRLALDFGAEDAPPVDAAAEAHRIAAGLIERLPLLRRWLFEDAVAAWRSDPSCRNPVEALYTFPGLFAVTRHRIAHELHQLGVPLLPRLIAEHAHRETGIDIHPGATIGRSFFIDHGTGVVIGETAIICDRVTLYQGVTLGAKSFPTDDSGKLVKGLPRHPVVEDDVTIYANATVLGRVVIGQGSLIGGNVWLTHSVPARSRIFQAQLRESGFESGGGI